MEREPHGYNGRLDDHGSERRYAFLLRVDVRNLNIGRNAPDPRPPRIPEPFPP
jgi:hypothetical protein